MNPSSWVRFPRWRMADLDSSSFHHSIRNAELFRESLVSEAQAQPSGAIVSGFLWILVIGLVAGVIARFLLPGPNNPNGFVLTAVLGIAGAFLATWIGQSVGWYRPDQGAGLIGAILGAVLVLFVWHRLVVQRVVSDPATSRTNWPPPRR
jgi:uncharacterized membrane protein YeaQ/YmgE (transglycosylase-associated protein family)